MLDEPLIAFRERVGMPTAREVRAKVRAQMAEQMAARQKAALSMASAWGKVEKARERLAAAERDARPT